MGLAGLMGGRPGRERPAIEALSEGALLFAGEHVCPQANVMDSLRPGRCPVPAFRPPYSFLA
jgi:hypothetical protein